MSSVSRHLYYGWYPEQMPVGKLSFKSPSTRWHIQAKKAMPERICKKGIQTRKVKVEQLRPTEWRIIRQSFTWPIPVVEDSDNSPQCAILLLCAQCPGLWIESKLKVTLQTLFFTCKWSSLQVCYHENDCICYKTESILSSLLFTFFFLPRCFSNTLSQRTDFLQSNDRKNPTQSETITRTVSLPAWYILEYPPVSVETTANARSVFSVNRFEVCINQRVLRQDV